MPSSLELGLYDLLLAGLALSVPLLAAVCGALALSFYLSDLRRRPADLASTDADHVSPGPNLFPWD